MDAFCGQRDTWKFGISAHVLRINKALRVKAIMLQGYKHQVGRRHNRKLEFGFVGVVFTCRAVRAYCHALHTRNQNYADP